MPVLKLFYLFVLLLTAPFSHAWSVKVHSEMAKAAYAELTPNQQNAYARLLKGNKISKPKYSPATQIGYLARWPDQLRGITLQELFATYGSGRVPRALSAYSRQNTNDWHYENALYVTEQGRVVDAGKRSGRGACPPPRNGQLLTVWPLLLKAYRQSSDSRDKTLLLSFILHTAGDAHQPLHVMAGLKPDCGHDGGGNGFCVSPGIGRFTGRKERCKTNLHQAWDRAFGLFDKKFEPAKAKQNSKAADLQPLLALHRSWAKDIYPSPVRPFDSAAYQNRAREITQAATSRAVAHQVQLLKDLVPR